MDDLVLVDELGDLDGKHGGGSRDECERRGCAAGAEEVEDGQVEMERRMAREPILVSDAELIDRPLHESQSVAMRQHHSLRSSGRARGVEDVGEILIDPADSGGSDGILQISLRGRHECSVLEGEFVGREVHHDQVVERGAFVDQVCPPLRLTGHRDQVADARNRRRYTPIGLQEHGSREVRRRRRP